MTQIIENIDVRNKMLIPTLTCRKCKKINVKYVMQTKLSLQQKLIFLNSQTCKAIKYKPHMKAVDEDHREIPRLPDSKLEPIESAAHESTTQIINIKSQLDVSMTPSTGSTTPWKDDE